MSNVKFERKWAETSQVFAGSDATNCVNKPKELFAFGETVLTAHSVAQIERHHFIRDAQNG